MSAELKRHIGKLRNTDRRCVVVYMQIPNRLDHALIIDTDALPDQFHQALMDVVESTSANSTINLADVLDRRASPDAGMNLMNSFHARGFMRAERIENIIMLPRPNMPFPLSEIIKMNNKDKANTAIVEAPQDNHEKFNQHKENINADSYESKYNLAKSILMDAQLLEDEANRKKNRAYDMMPSLRPTKPTGSISTLLPEDGLLEKDIAIATAISLPDIGNFETLEEKEMRMIAEKAQSELNSTLAAERKVGRPKKNAVKK